MIWLNEVWFVGLAFLLSGYAILDGFDLGVGILHLFAREDRDRRIFLNAIGPVWDGNEVWLVTAGGALFAAFPEVYSVLLSGFYLPVIFLLFALIFRAVSIEFRSKRDSRRWRRCWDISFASGSLGVCLILGLIVGNLARGLVLSGTGDVALSASDMLHPYSVLVAIMTVALFTMHGAIYLALKTEGRLQKQVTGWVRSAIVFFVLCYAVTTMATLLYVPRLTSAFQRSPYLFALPIVTLLFIAAVPRCIYYGKEFYAFLCSCAAIVGLFSLFAVGSYPYLIYNRIDPAKSWDVFNAASSEKTLSILLIVAVIGLPIVVTYTAFVYWVFRGRVVLGKTSY